jgi:hypothetical protein
METKEEILLPDEFEINEYRSVTFREGGEILDYCKDCTEKTSCGMNKNLRDSMGNDYAYWTESFLMIDIKSSTSFL